MWNRRIHPLVILTATAAVCFAQDAAEPSPGAPEADRVLTAMSEFLSAMPAFSFTADIAFDAVEPDDEKIAVLRRSEISVMRPNRIRAESLGSNEWNKTVVYDGAQLVVVDRAAEVYSKTAVPDTIDAMLDHLFEKYGMSVPTADFLFSDVKKVLTEGATSIRYIGNSALRGQPCHHIAVRQEAVDYQLWIAAGAAPVPVRMVVSYKLVAAMPRYEVDFSAWRRPLAAFTEQDFAVEIPESFEEVEMTPTPTPAQAEGAEDSE